MFDDLVRDDEDEDEDVVEDEGGHEHEHKYHLSPPQTGRSLPVDSSSTPRQHRCRSILPPPWCI
jgi:hypothetical protein